ncbi:hypothetical protein Sango_1512400 [Sesamum angolense]|uniref:RAB6-interacting golgin n=1 Tax=Sesamum angolense TaxID=2727404 RepID=A0AAE1WNF4_9LAMI|nr:hypothetical protein Sango_1512400 [Sesamum angolense]
MTTKNQQQMLEQQQAQMLRVKNSGMINHVGSPLMNEDKDEEMTRSALAAFRAKEEEIEKRKAEVREKVQAQLGRVEEETRRLAEIREEKEYKEALEAFNEKNREKGQLVAKLVELVTESEKQRLKKLEELCKNIDALH